MGADSGAGAKLPASPWESSGRPVVLAEALSTGLRPSVCCIACTGGALPALDRTVEEKGGAAGAIAWPLRSGVPSPSRLARVAGRDATGEATIPVASACLCEDVTHRSTTEIAGLVGVDALLPGWPAALESTVVCAIASLPPASEAPRRDGASTRSAVSRSCTPLLAGDPILAESCVSDGAVCPAAIQAVLKSARGALRGGRAALDRQLSSPFATNCRKLSCPSRPATPVANSA